MNKLMEDRLEILKKETVANHNPLCVLSMKKRIGKGKGTFVERDLFESEAFWALSGAAPQILIYLLGKRVFKKERSRDKHSRCINSNDLTLSYIELSKLGVTQPRATRGFDSLLARGFMELKRSGGGYQGDQSVYSLSNKWMLWRPGTVFSKRPKVINRGFQGRLKKQHTKP